MRRRVTLRSTLQALIAAPLLLAALPAVAEDASGTIISIVSGLAPDDLLNIRATASATAKTQLRLPNGAAVKNLGCNEVNGNPWCKVEDTQNAGVGGWAPARYLTPTNPAPVPDGAAEIGPSEAVASTPEPNLTARLGSADTAEPPSAADIGRTAMQDAYGLAFASEGTAASGAPDAASEIPCARYVGQPMTRCGISVARAGGDSAVTVTWPDGGTRIISFHAGLPSASDAPGEFGFTREGSLNMIRVGASERFEITDALVLGD